MVIPEKNQAIPFQADNPGEWLSAYLHTRAQLGSYRSDFQCDPACTRPGCKNPDLQVPVSIVDLLGAAGQREASVSDLYQRHYSLGLLANARDDWIRMVSLRLKKPCAFLENDRCGIYPVRPLPCMLFPEYLVNEGTFEAHAGKEHFRDFLCLKNPILLSPERAQAMTQLKRMWEREILITSFYLFQHGACHLDCGNLAQELLQAAGSQRDGESAEGPEPLPTLPNQVLEGFFLERLALFQPFAGVREKIQQLHHLEGQAQFLRLLQDERLVKKLKQGGGGRALVFRLVKGKLKAKRRSLLPRECRFY